MTDIIYRPTGNGYANESPVQYPATGEHWDKVDEVVADDDTTYVAVSVASSVDKRELFSYSPSVGGGNINYVRVYTRLKVVWGKVSRTLRISNTNYDSTPEAVSTGYLVDYTEWTVNPETSSRWNWGDVYSLQFGFYITVSTFIQYYCTQCWMVVNYDDDLGGGNILIGDHGFL